MIEVSVVILSGDYNRPDTASRSDQQEEQPISLTAIILIALTV